MNNSTVLTTKASIGPHQEISYLPMRCRNPILCATLNRTQTGYITYWCIFLCSFGVVFVVRVGLIRD